MKMNKCLYCYKDLTENNDDYHKKCSKLFFGTENPPKINYSLNRMSELAKNVIERSISVPGVQPKLSMSVFNQPNNDKRLTVVGALDGNFILKPPSLEYSEMPANEHLTMKLAELYQIDVVPNTLIRLASGELSYITKRIDRSKNSSKIHMIDMFQILEAFDKYRGSMERVGKAINNYVSNTLFDKLRFFELTIFCYLTGNNDMHLKNFSLIKDNDNWKLSPAYDLLNVAIVNIEDTEELALTISGKKKKITKDIFTKFGLELDLTEIQINRTYLRFKKKNTEVENMIKQSFLSNTMQNSYIELFLSRIKNI